MLAPDCSESLGGLFFQLLARKLFVGWRQDKEPEDAAVDGRLQTYRSRARISRISVVRGSPVSNPNFTKSGTFRSDDRSRGSVGATMDLPSALCPVTTLRNLSIMMVLLCAGLNRRGVVNERVTR